MRKGNRGAFNEARKFWVQPLKVEPLAPRDPSEVQREDEDIKRRREAFPLY